MASLVDGIVCSERVEIIPNVWCGANFVEAHMRWYGHFSWQAQYFVWVSRCGSAIFVAATGNREVARCDGGHISWQAQCFVPLCALDVWTRKDSWQAQGIVRL